MVRQTHHGPIVNEALRADDAEPLALRFMALDFPGIARGRLDDAGLRQRPGPGGGARRARAPCLQPGLGGSSRLARLQDRSGSLPVRRGDCPDLPEARLDGQRTNGMAGSRTTRCPRSPIRTPGFLVTANNRIAPEDIPTTSRATTSTAIGPRIEELIDPQPEHDFESFEAMQTDMVSVPGLETARRLARLRPRDQRERAAIERLRSWDGRMSRNRSRRRSTRRSPCDSDARSPGRRWRTAILPSAGSIAPTTDSLPT